MTNFLEKLYRDFLRNKIHQKYIYNNPNYFVLGENILNGYYYVLLSEWGDERYEYSLIIENCKHPDCKHIQLSHNPEYDIFKKSALKNIIPKKAFETLIKNGLFKDINSGYDRKKDNLAAIHRLNMCMYTDIKELEVHHNNKKKRDNFITNLTPIHKPLHYELDNMPEPQFSRVTSELHNNFKKDLHKQKRNTLSNRDELVIEILILLSKGLKPEKIAKKYRNRIQKSKIYQIKRYYFYLDEFLNYLYNLAVKGISTLDGIYDYQWKNIWEFNANFNNWNQDIERFLDYIRPLLKNEYKISLYARGSPYY